MLQTSYTQNPCSGHFECNCDFATTAGISSPERRTYNMSFAVRGLAMNKCPSARFRTGGHPLV
jgi:hypothetical protein